ncbi:MAG TPA: dihydropteroate synthase [Solirubrobacteraceae bacterium]|nr:dihydropteroate synthase [Solirubrobacteraceae bacterium]
MSTPVTRLRAGDRTISFTEPWLMGIVNATPDSFSDAGLEQSLDARARRAGELVAAGARFIDIGGESGVTNRPAVAVAEEIARVVPVIERVHAELDVAISVDTYKPEVARAAIAAGACLVNDVSGLRDPELADVCAQTGAGLVLMHTRVQPKRKLLDPSFDGRIRADVMTFLDERIELAVNRGVSLQQIVLDPGPDFAKTPAQTIDVLASLDDLRRFARPVLLAVSRKDFVGALTGRAPRDRAAGTLAALGHGVQHGAHLLRVHDVAAARDFLLVQAALNRELAVPAELRLDDAVRWQQEDARSPRAESR